MTIFTRDADGIPRCQVLVDGKPCNGPLYLTADGHNLACIDKCFHGKLIPVTKDQAEIIRQAYRRRDNPSQAELNRRWKESLPVAVKVGAVTKTACDRDVVTKKRVTAYQIAEAMYKVVQAVATKDTIASGLNLVACVVNKSGSRSAKVFAPLTLTQDQIEKLKKQRTKNDQGRTRLPAQ